MFQANFKDRVVIVAGAAGNLGVAAARAFLGAEASLALLDRTTERLGDLIPELANTPWHAFSTAVDLLDARAVEQAVNGIQSRLGRIDVLVNAVGGYRGGNLFHETPDDAWEFLLDINLRTLRNTCRFVLPHMLSQGAGRIINVAARSALVAGKNNSAYSAVKSAVLRLTESLSAEYKEAGINVNCILPGTIDTPQNREAMPKADFSRWTPPEAIADVVLFLASDAAREVHAAAIPV
jgi:NAD(P)-dependent dehydrogenase (short-subunit alcohol dehydrogenase family)